MQTVIYYLSIFFREANNAIAQLDGKPPLNWEVAYAAPRNDERLHQQPDYCLETDYDRQTPLFTTHRTVGMRQVAYPRPPPEMCSSHPTGINTIKITCNQQFL